MQNAREIIVLRTMLRDVNVEHSALLRKASEGKPARLAELKRQRLELMSRICQSNQSQDRSGVVGGHGLFNVMPRQGLQAVVLPAVGVATAAIAAGLRRYWAGWMGADSRERKTA